MFRQRGTADMKRKIRIKRVSAWNIGLTILMAFIFIALCFQSETEFKALKSSTEQYLACEKAAKQLEDGSDYLTEQVRLYVSTGDTQYRDLYFREVNSTKRRENAIEYLQKYFGDADGFKSLQEAMDYSQNLMETEYYAMRLEAEGTEEDVSSWPEVIQSVDLSEEDQQLQNYEKTQKAQQLVCSSQYQDAKNDITKSVSKCVNELIKQTRNKQGRATTIFSDMYLKLEIGIIVLVVMMLIMCISVRRLIVKPLMSYNESIQKGEIFPVIGAAELQNLAETYNKVYLENQETQKLIRHQAEHDSMTELLNRGSFEKLLKIYEEGSNPFALLLVDVDIFKSVNDTYGHAVGDELLKRVALNLKNAFRSIDYVCRIGGDEFAIIMVDVTSDLQYTIKDKIAMVSEELAKADGEVPPITLSVGVAFSDRENPGDNIFKDADKVLYYVKENGKNGVSFY